MSNLVAFNQEVMMPSQVKAQVGLIHQVMDQVMQNGQHYGVIPGCGTKPTLLKPGAEKILTTFRLVVDPEIEDLSGDRFIRYRIKCRIRTFDGTHVGTGVGECSSLEEKYHWRKARNLKEYEAAPENERRIKYGKWEEKQVRQNPADFANTILKMAKKRALVDACLTVTAASDIFTQDIEDMSDTLVEETSVSKEPEPDFTKASKKPLRASKGNGGTEEKISIDEKLSSLYKDIAAAETVEALSDLWVKNKEFVKSLPGEKQNSVKSAFTMKKEDLQESKPHEAPEASRENLKEEEPPQEKKETKDRPGKMEVIKEEGITIEKKSFLPEGALPPKLTNPLDLENESLERIESEINLLLERLPDIKKREDYIDDLLSGKKVTDLQQNQAVELYKTMFKMIQKEELEGEVL